MSHRPHVRKTLFARYISRREPISLIDLKEEALDDGQLTVDADGSFELSAGPARIVTVAVAF